MALDALKLLFFALIFLSVLLEVAGDVLFKKWSIESKNMLLIAGLSIYFIGSIFWAFSLKYEYLSKSITVFTVFNLIAVALAGVVLFKEDLSLINKLGIIAGVISVILVEI